MPKSMLYKLNSNFEKNNNLNAIEFNQIDQRTYFTLQMKCDKINRHKIFCFLCKSYVNEAHFNEYHYANHECDKCGIFLVSQNSLRRHKNKGMSCSQDLKIKCSKCAFWLSPIQLERHVNKQHENNPKRKVESNISD